MCWACDNPGGGWEDYLGHVRSIIAATGWAVQSVERERMRPPWAYTVGMTEAGKPELLVTGLPITRASRLLNDVGCHLLHSDAPAAGEQVRLVGGPLIEIVEVEVPDAHLQVAVALYGEKIRALQVVHADGRGRWPWDVGYLGVRGGQPVLGARARVAGRT
jgi:hypothetical protein